MFSPLLPSTSVHFSDHFVSSPVKVPNRPQVPRSPSPPPSLTCPPQHHPPTGQAPDCSFRASKTELDSWVRLVKVFVVLPRVIASRAEESHDLLVQAPGYWMIRSGVAFQHMRSDCCAANAFQTLLTGKKV